MVHESFLTVPHIYLCIYIMLSLAHIFTKQDQEISLMSSSSDMILLYPVVATPWDLPQGQNIPPRMPVKASIETLTQLSILESLGIDGIGELRRTSFTQKRDLQHFWLPRTRQNGADDFQMVCDQDDPRDTFPS